LCELYNEHKIACKKYYKGKGKQLVDLVSQEEINKIDKFLTKRVKDLVKFLKKIKRK
jgi:hypothetical protein